MYINAPGGPSGMEDSEFHFRAGMILACIALGMTIAVTLIITTAPEAEAHGGCDLILEWAEHGKIPMNESMVQWCMELPPNERPGSFFKGEVVTDTKSFILYKMGGPIGLTLAAGVGLMALGVCVSRNLKRERI